MKRVLPFFLILFFLIQCGGSSSNNDDTSSEDDSLNTVNTEKLIGTPFEGLETGDDFDWDFFLCGDYRTEKIDSFPIKIFAAFFTGEQEQFIQDGIDIANEAVGFTAYELTDEWSDDVRVIYRVEDIVSEDGVDYNAIGHTSAVQFSFNNTLYAERISTDWLIEALAITESLVAHELGHATAIAGHELIDYENDARVDLEMDSIMEADGGSEMTDYNFMMERQGQIMQDHLSDTNGTLKVGFCD